MDSDVIIILVVIIVFFVLAIIAMYKYDTVKQTLEVIGIKFGIEGTVNSSEKKNEETETTMVNDSKELGKSSIKVGGEVVNSELTAKSRNKSEVEIAKDVKESGVYSEANDNANIDITGSVSDSILEAKSDNQ